MVKILQKIFFSRTSWLISTKLGMKHRGLLPIIVCSKDNPGVTLTYFMARSFCNLGFLAHLSQRLIGELIVYPCSGVRCRCRRSCCRRPPFSNVFFSETAWPIKAKFYVEPPWEGGTKVYINGLGHMTKMAAMPIYGKNLKNLLFKNRRADFHETWYVASGTPAHHSLYK